MRSVLQAFLALSAFTAAHAGASSLATMVKDLTLGGGFVGSSDPIPLGFAGQRLVFASRAWDLGEELWSTDGSVEGTILIRDFCPGRDGSGMRYLGSTSGRVVFSARPDCIHSRLFSTDGTPEGTAELLGGAPYSFDDVRPAIGLPALSTGRLLFFGLDASFEIALFASDGTDAGTEAIAEQVQSDGTLTIAGALHYFTANHELWASDTTASGTSRVAILPESSVVEYAAPSSSSLLYFELAEANGRNLWRSDGTASGTFRLVDFAGAETDILYLDVEGQRAYLLVWDSSTGTELWTSDGTIPGTLAVTSFGPEYPFVQSGNPQPPFAITDNSAFFLADDGISGPQLWRAGPGTTPVALSPICDLPACWMQAPVAVGGSVFFVGFDDANGVEPRLSMGDPGDAVLVGDLCPGSCWSAPRALATGRDAEILFEADTGNSEFPTLFVLGPTPESLRRLSSDLLAGPYGNAGTRAASNSSSIYFSARDRHSATSLWRVADDADLPINLGPRGTENAGTPTYPGNLLAGPGEVFFVATATTEQPDRPALVRSAGDAESTRIVEWAGSSCNYNPDLIDFVGGRLLFADGCYFGLGLWALDPESESPVLLASSDETLEHRVVAGDRLYVFTRISGTNDYRLWTSDGTVSGTQPQLTLGGPWGGPNPVGKAGAHPVFFQYADDGSTLYTISANLHSLVPLHHIDTTSYFSEFSMAGSRAFYVRNSYSGPPEIWSTDGTPAGTRAAALPPFNAALRIAIETSAGFHLFLDDGTTTRLLSVDPAGATGVPVFTFPNYWRPLPDFSAAVAQRSFFAMHASSQALELWSSDGTAGGTRFVATIVPRTHFDDPPDIEALPDGVVFPGHDAAHGQELWRADADGTGAHLIQDIFPGPGSSSPTDFTVVGDDLYFTADDGVHGRELWVMSLTTGAPCRASARALCLENGRFRVESTWTDFAGRFGDATAVPISGDTGYFWFFDENNVELILKLIDGGGFNGHHWVYYGALSNIEYAFTVTDSVTGAAKRYFNPATRFASSGDIRAFGPQGAHAQGQLIEATTQAATPPAVSLAGYSQAPSLPGACVASATRFCILDNRFAVTATWRDFHGNSGTANAGTLTDDTGYLWFFNEANVEVVLKMVDAGTFNQHFWVYYGALSNVEYTLTVTDTVAGGPPRVYHNALGQFGSFGDIEAFPAP